MRGGGTRPRFPFPTLDHNSRILVLAGADEWLVEQSSVALSIDQKMHLKSLFEAQVERHRMFTSCGWFFDDFDRIEPKNNVAYAAHAIWLAERAAEVDLYAEAINAFRPVVSGKSGLRGDDVFSTAFYRFRNRC